MVAPGADSPSGSSGEDHLLAGMSSPQIRSLLERAEVDVIIPLGALEQHGPHLPLGTDTVIAESLASIVARRVDHLAVAPCLPVGCSDHHLSFAGTASLSQEAVVAYVRSVAKTLLRHGFRYVYVVTAHAGNIRAMKAAVESLDAEIRAHVAAFVDWPQQREQLHAWARQSIGLSAEEVGSHSGHFETSIMLALAPELVDMFAAPRGFIGSADEASNVMMTKGMAAVSEVGVVGDARGASPAAGKGYMEVLVASLVHFIEGHRSAAGR
jgi:creatinine amidohydrolase/Fe(II)-dependent formamide hydrolase-like protein